MASFERDEFRYDERRFRDDLRRQERMERVIDEAMRELEQEERRLAPPNRLDSLMQVVNDTGIQLSKKELNAINDDNKMMNGNREIVRARDMSPSGLDVIRSSGQFTNLVGSLPLPKPKRTRRKTKMDKTMSMCLKEANKRMRKKNGKLRKGKSMRDVMKLAHRLCKKS